MLLGFKKRFAEPILIGTKVHTLRDRRKLDPKPGETLYMYTGLRTNNCELITDKERLIGKQKAWIKITYHLGDIFYPDHLKVCIDGRALSVEEVDQFVRFDGFTDWLDFAWFWLDGVKDLKRDIKKKGMVGIPMKLVASKTLYHWTDLKY